MLTDTSLLDRLLPRASPVLRILAAVDQEDLAMQTLADVISIDPVLTARIMRLANSWPYRRGASIASVSRALVLMGTTTAQAVVARAALPLLAPEARSIPDDLWLHCVVSASGARVAAGILSADADQAFAAGLLHDIGGVATVLAQGEGEATVGEQTAPSFPVDHPAVGAIMAEGLGLPAGVVDAIRDHHSPVGGLPPLSQAVILGEALAGRIVDSTEGPSAMIEVADQLGLSSSIQQLVEMTRAECDRLARLTELPR